MVFLKILISLYLFIAVLLTQFSAAYFYSKARTNYRKAFSALTLCVSLYLFGYLMIFNSSSLSEAIFWNQIQYLGLPFISVLWLIVALLYTKTIYTLSRRMMVLLFCIPVITFILRFTNPWHHLFYKFWVAEPVFGYFALSMERGAWYYVNITYTILCLLAAVFVTYLFGYIKHKAPHTRRQFLIFFLASILPLAGIIMILSAYGRWSIDYTALIMPVSLFIISYGILRYDFLEIKALARETIFENGSAAMVILEPGLRIIDYNRAAKAFFHSLNIPLHTSIRRMVQLKPELRGIFGINSTRDFALIINGEKRFFEIDSVPLGYLDHGNARMLKTIRDVTEKKKVQEKLHRLATMDSLSGLYNRGEFTKLAQQAFDRAKTHGETLALLMIDLDRFKSVNDTFGHAAGDEVIRKLGRLIGTSFRKTDIAGRLGGDEFAVVLVNTSLDEAKPAAQKFLETVARTRVIYGPHEISITASIGIAAAMDSGDDHDIENVLKRADEALYRAKARGGNCVADAAADPAFETILNINSSLDPKAVALNVPSGKPDPLPVHR